MVGMATTEMAATTVTAARAALARAAPANPISVSTSNNVVGGYAIGSATPFALASALSGSGAISGSFIATLNSSDPTPDLAYAIGVVADAAVSGQSDVSITGNAGSGFNGTAILANDSAVELGGTEYRLYYIPQDGGVSASLPEGGTVYGMPVNDVILAEGAGNASSILINNDANNFWQVNGTGDQVFLQSGTDQFYLAGAQAQYAPSWNAATATLTLSLASGAEGGGAQGVPLTGATSFTLSFPMTGSGEINFGDGGIIGLGDTGNAIEYIAPYASASLEGDGDQTLYGSNNNTALFTYGESLPDATWDIRQVASGQGAASSVVFTGADAGYDGNVTLNGFATVDFSGTDSSGNATTTSYNLLTAPLAGGSLTVTTNIYGALDNIVAETAGTTNAITFDSAGTTYLNDVGVNDTLTLQSGTTEIYMADDEADYAQHYNGATGTLTLTDSASGGNGTTTIVGTGYTIGEVVFADGAALSLGNFNDDTGFEGGLADLGSDAGLPEQNWTITQAIDGTAAAGRVTFDGASDGYPSPVSLSGVSVVELGGTAYGLDFLPLAGGASTVTADEATIVVDGGSNETLNFTNDAATYAANGYADIVLGPAFWHDNGSGDQVTLASGQVETTLLGNEADYTVASGTTTVGGAVEQVLTLTDTNPDNRAGGSNGVTTFTEAGGTGDILFQDGGDIWLGRSSTFVDSTATTTTIGTSGTGGNYVTFTGVAAGSTPGATDNVTENTGGQVVISGGTGAAGSGFAGQAILGNIQGIAAGGVDYDLIALPLDGGTASIVTPTDGAQGTVVAEGHGPDDITFDSADTSYLHLSAAGDTLALAQGYTEIDALGAASDYTVASNGATLTLVDNNPASRAAGSNGTTTIDATGGSGDIVFSDGSDISVANTAAGATAGTPARLDLSLDLAASEGVSLTGGSTALSLDDAAANYTAAYVNGASLSLTDGTAGTGTTTIDLAGGDGTITFADGTVFGLGTSADASVYYGVAGGNVFTLDGGDTTAHGSTTGSNLAVFAGSTGPNAAWRVTDDGAGDATITGDGTAATGYTGAAVLTGVGEVTLGGAVYDLLQAADAGTTTIAKPSDGAAGTILAEHAGGNSFTFASTDETFWYAGTGSDSATLGAGTTEIYFAGAESQYTVAYNGATGTVTVTDSVAGRDGIKTLALAGGAGELVFGDGGKIGLGGTASATDPVQYGSDGNDVFQAAQGAGSIDGGAGKDVVDFSGATVTVANNQWSIAQNAAGQVVIAGANAGFAGTATLTDIEQVDFGGTTYDLVATPSAGGPRTVSAPSAGASATILVDGVGSDTLTFDSPGTSDWHVGVSGASDAATLEAGTTNIYLAGAPGDYTITNPSTTTVVIADNVAGRNGTLTLTLAGGAYNIFSGNDTQIQNIITEVGTANSQTFTVASGNYLIEGLGGTNTLAFSGQSNNLLDSRWAISQNASGEIVLNGAGAGYDGTVTVENIQQVSIAGTTYGLLATPSGGGSLTVNSGANVVVDGAGTDTIGFSSGASSYWHAGAGTTTATLYSGTTEVYFSGAESQYALAYNGSNTLTVTDSVAGRNGAKTITMAGGEGELVFADGSKVGLGSTASAYAPDPVQYGSSGADTFYVAGGASFVDGGAGVDTVYFQSGTGIPDARWQVSENAAGQVVVNGANAGYNGTATLADVEQVELANVTYALIATPAGGGSTTVTASNALVVDGAGNDVLTFNSGATSYWHAGAGTTAATLSSGITELYFAGAESQYTISYSGSALTVSDNVAGRNGTKTITLAGGKGDLLFADGSTVGLGASQSSSSVDGSQYGSSGNDTFYVDGGASFVDGGAGANIVYFQNSGSGGADQRWRVSQNSLGQVVINGTEAGYNGTATLADIQQVSLAGTTYNLRLIPDAGGTLSVTSGTNLVVDGANSDSFSFSGGNNYWHTGGGSDTATISGGTTEIYFAGGAADYTESYNAATSTLTVTNTNDMDGNGTKTLTLTGGTGELVFADGSRIGLGNSQSSSTPDLVQYGSSGGDTIYINGGNSFVDGGAGNDIVEFSDSGNDVADGRWNVSQNSLGQFVINGTAAGYNGTATLADVEQAYLGGTTYNLFATPAGGGNVNVNTGYALVTDGAGTDTLTFDSNSTSYWHAGAGTTAATLTNGTTEVYFSGAESQYSVTYNGSNTVTVSDSVAGRNGTKTITLSGGNGELVFADGSKVGLGNSLSSSIPDATQYGTGASNNFYVDGGSSFIDGGAGTDTVYFQSGTGIPDARWQVTENAAGQVVINGANAGYDGTATLADVEQVGINGTYTLYATPAGGGSTTVTANYALVADGVGTNTLTFNSNGYSYWHAGAGTTAATLTNGTTEIYFAGAAADYTESYNQATSTLTVANTNDMDGTGTKTLTLTGGEGDLVFTSGASIGFGSSQVSSDPDTTQYGTSGTDTFYVDGGASFVQGGSGTAERVDFANSGGGLADGRWSISENASGQIVIGGSASGIYNGSATLAHVQQAQISGSTYNLFATPAGGGSLTVNYSGNGYGNAVVVDGTGTDTLTLSNPYTTYWHAGAGTTAATLTGGTTEIYFAGGAADYTESYNAATSTLTVTNTNDMDGNGTKTLTLTGGTGELVFADGSRIGLGNSQSSSTPDLVQYGSSGGDTIYINGGNSFVDGGAGNDIVEFSDSGNDVADGRWNVSQNSLGQVVINGANAGYDGTATLADVEQAYLGGTTYTLFATPAGGGNVNVNTGYALVTDGAGSDTLTFSNPYTSYWHAGAGTTAATLANGTTEIYFLGAESQYSVSYNGNNTVTVTDSVAGRNGTKTITLSGGNGELVFADGSKVGLGNSLSSSTPDATQYGTGGNNNFYVDGGSSFIDGGAGTDTVYFQSGTGIPDARWQVTENAAGQVVINGANAGYDGTATLADVEQVGIYGTNTLYATPAGGGGTTVTAGNAIVVDGAGTDTITFNSNSTSYWHAGTGTTAATLTDGTTEIYFAGAAADYTESYNQATSTLTVANTNDMDGTGTKTLTLTGGEGDLVFTDGTKIGIGSSQTSNTPDQVQYGTSTAETLYINGGTTYAVGGQGSTRVIFNNSPNPLSATWLIGQNASGQVIFNGINAGYDGIATLANVQQVMIDGSTYNLLTTPVSGGSLSVSSANNLIVDGSGNDTLSFTSSGTDYWFAGGGNDTATLSAGTTDIYLTGAAADYTITNPNSTTEIITDSVAGRNGTKTLNLAGGSLALYYGSDAAAPATIVETATAASQTFTLTGGNYQITGSSGTNRVAFNVGTTNIADTHWQIAENSSGQVVINGNAAGYDGTGTLTNIQEVTLDGTTYNLFTTPAGGGSVTVNYPGNGYGNAVVVDGAGTDTLTLSNPYTTYWHAGAGTTAATLTSGFTEVYFAGAAADYTESYNAATSTLTVANTNDMDGNGTKTIATTTGTGELVFADGSRIGLGSSQSSSMPDLVQYGSSGGDTIYVNGGNSFVDGGAGNDIVEFSDSGSGAADGRWNVSQNSLGQVVINGLNAGYDGTATLADVEQAYLGGTTYNLFATPAGGGNVNVNTGYALVTDGAGTDTLTFSNPYTSYWHAGAGTTAATLTNGTTEIYFLGAESQYSVTYNGSNTVTVSDSVAGRNGTKTITLSGGNGELVFADGSKVGLGNSLSSSTPDAIQYGTGASNNFYVDGGSSFIDGGAGTDYVQFQSGTGIPDARWQVTENASGQVVINGANAGYDGTATLADVEQVGINGTYTLYATPAGGGSTTVTANYALVADGVGTNTLTFNSNGYSYWHAGAGTTAATLTNGTTEIYFAGSAADYTESYNQATSTLTVANTNDMDGTGTKTLTLTGGEGDLVFTDGTKIGIGSSQTSTTPDQVQYGTSGTDTFYVDGGASFVQGGSGSAERVDFANSGGGLADGRWSISENASGQIVIGGSASGIYNGTATLAHVQQALISGTTYNLFATPTGGGSLTVNYPGDGIGNAVVVDGAGTDTLTLYNPYTTYWHAGAGTTAATLTSGFTEVYFAGAAADYTESYNAATSTLTVANTNDMDGNGTKTIATTTGTGELVFADGTRIGLGSSQSSSMPDTVQYGSSGGDTIYVNGGNSFVDGGAGSDIVEFSDSGNGVADTRWNVSQNSLGQFVINGTAAGYNGTATLADVEQAYLGGTTYTLYATPAGGGNVNVNTGYALVTDGAGSDTLTFDSNSTSYWHAGAGTTAATLTNGTTEIYFLGAESQYSVSYNGNNTVTVTDSVAGRNGTKTITLSGGNGELVFADGSRIGLGNSLSSSIPDATQYGTSASNTLYVDGGSSFIDGGAGTDYVQFQSGSGIPDARWQVTENAAGQVVINGANAGYDGTATLADVEQVGINGTYTLYATPAGGGSTTVTANYALVADGAGTDTLTFNSNGYSYWHAGAGTTAATLQNGTTEIYFAGAESQYSIAYNGTNTVTVTDSVAGRTGTKTITLNGGSGELVFGDNLAIGLAGGGRSTDATQYGGAVAAATLIGTGGSDVLDTGVNNTVNGNGGSDTYLFSRGDGTVTINNGINSNNTAQGQVDLVGGLTDQNLWFLQSGNTLLVDVLGTTDQLQVNNWFAGGDNYSQVSQFDAAGLKLDGQISNLVQAMATYQTNNPGFHPQTASTTMPSDTTLQNTIAAAWHS